jgi:hypothetical protein
MAGRETTKLSLREEPEGNPGNLFGDSLLYPATAIGGTAIIIIPSRARE